MTTIERTTGPSLRPDSLGGRLLIDLGLVAAILLVFGQASGFDFAKVDDTYYVTKNAHVLGGIGAGNIAWAFRSFEAENWHPLTWISLMIDATIGGGGPRAFHATNIALHVANALLLFHLLFATTRSALKSAFVAALFAVHPLHVESVAWVTERKDVLSTFFWLIALRTHVAYARRPTAWRYAGVVAAFALGALSKPMVVTLPLTLWIFDYWPLERIGPLSKDALRDLTPIVEKLPLFALSLALSVVTLAAQASVARLATGPGLARAIVAYATYPAKMVWPTGLSIHYVFVEPIPTWEIAGCAIGLALATWLAFRGRARRRYLTAGWLWYVVTLVPVAGFVQVGEQSIADRYTYVPLIGLFVVIAWGVPDVVDALVPAGFPKRRVLAVLAGVVLACLAARAHDQTPYWRNGFELFHHAVEVNGQNALARMGLAQELAARGRDAEAIDQYREALRLRPSAVFAHLHLAECLERTGKLAEASYEFREILRHDPGSAEAGLGLGIVLMEEENPAEAAEVLSRASRSHPRNARIEATLGLALTRLGKLGEAEAALDEALRIDPENVLARKGLAVVLGNTGRVEEAIVELRRALEADPNQPDARANLARLLIRQGKADEARAVSTGKN